MLVLIIVVMLMLLMLVAGRADHFCGMWFPIVADGVTDDTLC